MIQTENHLPLKNLLEWNIEYQLGLTTKTVKKGEIFLRKGEPCFHLYFVIKGFIRVFYYDLEGNEMTHMFAYENSITTSPFSFFKREENILFFEAMEETELILITSDQLQKIIDQFEHTGEAVRNLFIEFGMVMSRRIMSIHTETAEERYLKLMKDYPEIFRKAKLIQIASYLGITPQSLSRIRKNL